MIRKIHEGEEDYQAWIKNSKLLYSNINQLSQRYNDLYDELFYNPENLSTHKDKWIIFKVKDKDTYKSKTKNVMIDKLEFTAKDKSYKLYNFEQVTYGNNPIFKVTKKALKDIIGRDGKTIMQPKGTERNINNISVNSLIQLIEKNELVPNRNYDLESLKTNDKDFYIKITRDIKEITHMSTDKGWSSCMDLKNGQFAKMIFPSIKKGLLVAYAYNDTLENIDSSKDEFGGSPVARISITPFETNDYNKFLFLKAMRVYGTPNFKFIDAVQQYLDDHYNKDTLNLDKVFYLDKAFYNDLGNNELKMSKEQNAINNFLTKNIVTDGYTKDELLSYLDSKEKVSYMESFPDETDYVIDKNKDNIIFIEKALEYDYKYIDKLKKYIPNLNNDTITHILSKQPDLINYFKNYLNKLDGKNILTLLNIDYKFFITYLSKYIKLNLDFSGLILKKYPNTIKYIDEIDLKPDDVEDFGFELMDAPILINKIKDKSVIKNFNHGDEIVKILLSSPQLTKYFNLDFVTNSDWDEIFQKFQYNIHLTEKVQEFYKNFNLDYLTDKQINNIPNYVLYPIISYNKNNKAYINKLDFSKMTKNKSDIASALFLYPELFNKIDKSITDEFTSYEWFDILKNKENYKHIDLFNYSKIGSGGLTRLLENYPKIVESFDAWGEIYNQDLANYLISNPKAISKKSMKPLRKDIIASMIILDLNLTRKILSCSDFTFADFNSDVGGIFSKNNEENVVDFYNNYKKDIIKYILPLLILSDWTYALQKLPDLAPIFLKDHSFKEFYPHQLISILEIQPELIIYCYNDNSTTINNIYKKVPETKEILANYKKTLKK